MEKDFRNWLGLKEKVHSKSNAPDIKEGQIWWCILGANVGDEEDGKGEKFSRPILAVRKFNRKIFWGVPLSTQIKEKFHYHKINFHGREQSAMLSQLRLCDTKRLTARMGKLTSNQLKEVREKLKSMI